MDLKTLEKVGRESADRREFLKKAGKVAATVPAVALLLSANATPAEAFGRYCKGGKGGGGARPERVHYRLQSNGRHGFGHPPRGRSHRNP